MKLPTDPHLLYSLVNMRLRNDYADRDDLVRSLDVDEEVLVRRLAEAGYVYDTARRQFCPAVNAEPAEAGPAHKVRALRG